MKKSELPEKICPVCNRPFTWRKKWKRHWQSVKYCSQKCRRQRHKQNSDLDQDQNTQKDSKDWSMSNNLIFCFVFSYCAVLHCLLGMFVIVDRHKGLAKTDSTSVAKKFHAKLRAHGNSAEYLPIALLGLYVLSVSAIHYLLILCLGFVLMFGRTVHAFGLIHFEQKKPPNFSGRVIGMACTFTCILTSVLCLLYVAIP